MQSVLDELFSGDDERSEAVMPQLAALTEAQAAEMQAALAVALAEPDAERRWWTVRALAALPGMSSTPLLARALTDADPGVRQCAALALRARPDPQHAAALLACLSDHDPLTARLAGDALAAIGPPAAPLLIEALQTGPHAVRLHAVRALAALGDPSAIPALFAAFGQDSALLEYWADLGLERLGVGTSFFLPQ